MKYSVIVISAFFTVALAQQQNSIDNSKYKHVPIVSLESNLEHDGTFNYAFETGDGTRVQQNGQLKQSSFDPKNVGEAVQGGYSYQVINGKEF
jgi:Insect cuticle protein